MLKRYLALFKALNAARVKYLVIGGLAAIAYGIPRSTKDADLIHLKRAAGRKGDWDDVALLEKIRAGSI
ncbi:hypothetical protein HUU05_06195 [candidate division KSB1 bacterium]|nr:hypothetical protein [candidate division KSB1 bacterium]